MLGGDKGEDETLEGIFVEHIMIDEKAFSIIQEKLVDALCSVSKAAFLGAPHWQTSPEM